MVGRAARTPTQTLSKRAFNSDHRLTLAREVLGRRGDLFDKKTVEQATGIPPTTVYNELSDLVELGALASIPDGSRVLFSVVDSPFWTWCEALLAKVETHPEPPTGNPGSLDAHPPQAS